jgi:hypothetical protein
MLPLLLILVNSWDYSLHGADWPFLCSSGLFQSPISLNSYTSRNITFPDPLYYFFSFNYTPALIFSLNTSISFTGLAYNPGLNFQLSGDFGSITLKSTQNTAYSVKYIKFHTPSEHMINDVQYPLELQIVHTNGNETLIVVVLFRESIDFSSPLISDIMQAYGALMGGSVDLNGAVGGWFAVKDFWYYEGGLTEPPCTEGVKYVVNSQIIPAAVEQVAFFQNILQENNREIKPQNSRNVTFYKGFQDNPNGINLLHLTLFWLIFT